MDAPDGASVPEPYLDPMLWRQLRGVLQFLQSNKYPHVPDPPPCKKRASVALIVRFRPLTPDSVTYDSNLCGATAATSEQRLENFFNQQWVQQGEPEILFIKRATRTGDRWTGQIAFPGGGREPNDGDDCATGVRETREEIGLDLNADHCMLVGNLPEQVVTTWWSKVPYA
jgi:8-oxo-dGTP pyrophosphatase MutT (NUDIX family)